MLRKLLSHAAIYGLASQVPRLAGVLALPLITQYLTPDDYGVAGVVAAYAYALTMLQSLGLSVVMVNAFARYPKRYVWVWRQLHGFLLLWSMLYGLLMLGVLYLAVPGIAAEDRFAIACLYSLPVMFFASTDMQSSLYYQLSQKPLPVALRSFLVGAVSVATTVFTIVYLRMGYMGWFYAHFLSTGVRFLFNSYSVYVKLKWWPIINFRWAEIKKALHVSLPVVPHNFSFFLLDNSDRLVLDVLKVPLHQIGLYNVASSFGNYFMIASNAVVQAASPFYMRYYAQQADVEAAKLARRMTFALQTLFLLTTSLGSLWMKEVFQLLIRNEALQEAYPLAIIILMGYNFRPMYLAAMNLLAYREHTNKLWKVSLVAGVANLGLNFLLVPVFGYQAAAFTTFAALMYMGYAGHFLKAYKQAALVNYYPLHWLSVTILALLTVYLLAAIDLRLKVVITSAGCTAAIVYLITQRHRLSPAVKKDIG
ncbi:lipopolysaccharide biosynthesis protein [Pontibacter sp. SGAir0037]|uniref:lipopolysaccharide biosynthesis protein n=1 Tax=Pontibacter sp. SGAir0037 TaxID=2571030 RepID=UPI0010CD69C0|nr:oligosaccharide flippase family protein [Pontibacter sp. SGAir0037]QCR24462.1 polysaccharide biosynthesis protein [Pontibacter sp. SGAir0037]